MTLLFMDGFDHYATAQLANKWTTATSCVINTTSARTGLGCLSVSSGNSGPTKTLPGNYQTLTAGYAFIFNTLTFSALHLIAFRDSTTTQVDVTLNASGTLNVTRNGTVLGTTTNAISSGVWYYMELKATIADTGGTYELRINGETWLSGTGDTKATANAYANIVSLRLGTTTSFIDDFYICNNAGSVNNNFLGDVKIETLMPNGVGYSSQWAVYPSGLNYQAVDEIPPNSDTDYVITSGIGYIDSYSFGNLATTSGSIFGIQVNPFARKDDAGTRVLANNFYINSVAYSGGAVSIGNTYTYWPYIQEVSPATSSYWGISEINDTEFGIKLVS